MVFPFFKYFKKQNQKQQQSFYKKFKHKNIMVNIANSHASIINSRLNRVVFNTPCSPPSCMTLEQIPDIAPNHPYVFKNLSHKQGSSYNRRTLLHHTQAPIITITQYLVSVQIFHYFINVFFTL